MQPTKASAVQKSSVLSRPIEKGVTKPVTARHSMLPTRTTPSTSTVRASTASSRLSLVPTTTTKVPTTNSRLSMAPTSATRSTTSTTTTTTRSTVPSARSAIPSTRATKAAAPTSIPAKTRYTSSKPITSTSLAEDTQAKQAAQKSLSEQQMNLKLEAMQGMMATLVSQMSVMQSQYQNPPDSPDKEPFPVLDLPPPIQPQVQPVIIKVPVHTNKRAQAPTHRSPPREIRIITKKIRKEVKKPKPPKPQIDTTVYTNQIADLTQKLEDLKKLKTEIEFNHQIQTETLNSKLQLLNTQLEYARNTNNVEREKNNQLKCEISTRTAENSQLETQFLIIKRQMTDEISNTKATLGEELRQKTEAFTNESNALQTEIEFFENQCEERSQEKVMLENCIAHEIKTTEITEKRIRTSETLRKKLHNEIQELKGNIRVICRVRPFLGREKPGSVKYSYPKGNQELLVERKAINDVTSKKPSGAKQDSFKFDRVFGPQASQAEVFEEISHLVQSALDGYNCCIFAYGQTGITSFCKLNYSYLGLSIKLMHKDLVKPILWKDLLIRLRTKRAEE